MSFAIIPHPNGGFLIASGLQDFGDPHVHDGSRGTIKNPEHFEDYTSFWDGELWISQKGPAMQFPTREAAEAYCAKNAAMLGCT